MKKTFIIGAVFCLLLAVMAVSAQDKTPNFAGVWELDIVSSKLDERARVEAMTMTVTQSEKELKIENKVKRALPADGENQGEGRRGGRMGGGFGDGTLVFTLDGKETTIPLGDRQASGTLKAAFEAGGKLKLTVIRKVTTPQGDFTFTTNETWELLNGGNNLKIVREMETRRGTQTSEMNFARMVRTVSADSSVISVSNSSSGDKSTPKAISGGVLNSKAMQLVKPTYSYEARAAGATGAVNVQVTIDEQGNVIFAKAVSGHELLRAASEEAARASKFTPTLLQGAPVKVTGIIVYNFVLQ